VVALVAAVCLFAALAPRAEAPLPFTFTDIAERAGLSAVTVYGGRETNRYLLETTGSGVAAFDFDNDGLLDIFLVNGTTLEGFPPGKEPTSHLYRNRGDGGFEDVTTKAGLALTGWGQGTCAFQRHRLPAGRHREPRPDSRDHRDQSHARVDR
jgi:enediyne biosynthesis protein E4